MSKRITNSTALLSHKLIALTALVTIISTASMQLRADSGTCGGSAITLPFTDVPNTSIFFCSIAEAYFSALTNGTDSTHYSPSDPVPREQMAAFITRTMDQSVKRSSRRAALNQYWTTQGPGDMPLTSVGTFPVAVQSDGANLWVANFGGNSVSQVRAIDGKLLDTWTGATGASCVLCARGKVFIAGATTPFRLYQIDPSMPAGSVTTLSSSLGEEPSAIAYDGHRIWTANDIGSVSIITLNPISVTTVMAGFTSLVGVIYDGANIWVIDNVSGSVDKLRKLDSSGGILLSVDVGDGPLHPAFDGTNIWVPNQLSNTVTVVRAQGPFAGAVIATLSGNGLNTPGQAAFDGERILVTNQNGNSVSLWKATDFTPIGNFFTGAGTSPAGACSDGLNFWITLFDKGELARF